MQETAFSVMASKSTVWVNIRWKAVKTNGKRFPSILDNFQNPVARRLAILEGLSTNFDSHSTVTQTTTVAPATPTYIPVRVVVQPSSSQIACIDLGTLATSPIQDGWENKDDEYQQHKDANQTDDSPTYTNADGYIISRPGTPITPGRGTTFQQSRPLLQTTLTPISAPRLHSFNQISRI